MKILKHIFDAIFYIFIIFLVLLAYGSINNNFYRVVAIEGNSMAPTMHFGDLMVIVEPEKNMPPNTIITMAVDGSLVTHRLLGYEEDGFPITKGDNNEIEDNYHGHDVQIVGKYLLHIPYVGYPLMWLSSLAHGNVS
jgi:signal peptidase